MSSPGQESVQRGTGRGGTLESSVGSQEAALTPRISIGMSPTTSPTTPYGFNQGRGDRKASAGKYAGIFSSIAGIIWKVGGGSPVMPLAFPAFVNSSHPLSGCPTRGGVAQYKLTGSGLWSAPSSESLLGRTRPQCHPHNAASPYLARWRQQVFFPPCECMGSLGQ